LPQEAGPNELLGHWLLSYKDHHPQGSILNATLMEQYVRTRDSRRRADRVIWAGLGRLPKVKEDVPMVVVEFVSAALRDRLESELRSTTPDLVIFAAGIGRLPNTSLVAVPGTKAETALIAFDLKGIALSSGSACSSGKVQPSHVLAAMGVEPALARAALRISLGWETIETDLDLCLNAWKEVVSSLGNQ